MFGRDAHDTHVATRRRGLKSVAWVLAVASVVSFGIAGWVYLQQRSAVDAFVAPVPASKLGTLSEKAIPPGKAAPKTTSLPATVVIPIIPVQVFIPNIGVNTKVISKPTEYAWDAWLGRKVDQFGVPDDMFSVAWWSSGAKPGSADNSLAVLLGHTTINGYGVFNDLGRLKIGEHITLESKDRKVLRFEVIGVKRGISKSDPTALQTVLTHPPAGARLALITCSGDVSGQHQSRKDNTVVFARLVTS